MRTGTEGETAYLLLMSHHSLRGNLNDENEIYVGDSFIMFRTEKVPAKTTKQHNLLRSLACLSGKWDSVQPAFFFFFTFHVFASNLNCNKHQTFSLTASCNLFIMSRLYTATKQLTVVSHKWKRYYLLSLFG